MRKYGIRVSCVLAALVATAAWAQIASTTSLVGTYRITAEHPGFEKITETSITVEINQAVRTDLVLKVGTVSQSVTVEAVASAIKTDDATVEEIIGTRDVVDLPLNCRDPMQLATTTPSVVAGLKATNGVPPGEDFIGACTREILKSMSLDGISIMNNLITTTPNRPTVDSIAEVEVQTGTYSAQYGAYLGVHINLISKTGTNDIHGTVLEFVRNQDFDARPFFLAASAAKAPLRQNQFGFELDGPIIIPKLYNCKDCGRTAPLRRYTRS